MQYQLLQLLVLLNMAFYGDLSLVCSSVGVLHRAMEVLHRAMEVLHRAMGVLHRAMGVL
jgi:hypothetical protein